MAKACLGILFFASVCAGCAHSPYSKSDHFDGKRFYNQDRAASAEKNFFTFLKWQFTRDQEEWPNWVDDNAKAEFKPVEASAEVNATLINHATVFLQFKSLNVISDPVFAKRVSPLSWLGPKRHRDPAVELGKLPKVDVVVVSHNHYDHMDLEALERLSKRDRAVFLVPLGNKALLEGEGIENVFELDWWQSHRLADGSVVTLVPMQHWSARGVFDRSESLWGGFVIEASGLKVLFAGDTGYNKQFQEIHEKFGPMDLSLLPIGAYEPRWFMKEQHMNPVEAVQAHQDLHSRASLGMHFGTFQLTDEGIDAPVAAMKSSLEAAKISSTEFVVPKNGQAITVKKR